MRCRVSILVLCLALLAGCGSNGGGKSTSTSPQQQAIAHASTASAPAGLVARTFLAAATTGHGGVACSLMTDRAVSRTAGYVVSTGQPKSHPAHNCEIYFMAYQTSEQGALASLRIRQVTVHGTRAQAEVICPICVAKFKHRRPLTLRKTAAGWRVDFDIRRGY